MKIRSKPLTYEEVLALPIEKTRKPKRPNMVFRTLLKVLSAGDLKATDFTYQTFGMEKLGKDEPCLILMNHSSFIDLKIASTVFYPRPMNIVCTNDGFVGKRWLMENLGCIPTRKFVMDPKLVKDMLYAFRELHSSILMYPEASYSFDGTATPLPQSLGKCLKLMRVPVLMVRTYGAFARDPLYNNLQLRRVKVSADVKYLLSPAEIAEKTVEELNEILKAEFTFDHFRWQQENKVAITEPFRADGLERVLYRCPHCNTEGEMAGKGESITCNHCGKTYRLSELGYLEGEEPAFAHIPDWFSWERECVRKELEDGTYRMDVPVDIRVLKNLDTLYEIGEGRLVHTKDGFHLTGCDGKLDAHQSPLASYSLYSDYFWYEIGDMISIYADGIQYYCFPKTKDGIAAKARLATEEAYKMQVPVKK